MSLFHVRMISIGRRSLVNPQRRFTVDRKWIPYLTRRDLRYFAGAYVCASIAGRIVACREIGNGVRVTVGGGPKHVPAPDPDILD
jgi:hypothetical protein